MYRGHNLQDVETMITPTLVVLVGTHNSAGETAHLTTNETEADTDLLGFEAHRRPLHYPNTWLAINNGFEEGGFKQSGIGRLRGARGLAGFQQIKTYVHFVSPASD